MEKQIFDITPKRTTIDAKKRVAAYTRVSCYKDTMLHSLEAQIDYYRKYIVRNPEWEFVGIYSDEAKTGTKEDREQFQRLLADCRLGKIDMIVVKSISRFARNTVTLLATVRELKALGISVFFEDAGIQSISEEGELMLTLLASQAQEESLSCSENCKWRIRKGFEQGITNTCTMLGYRLVNDEITIVPEEAAIVKKIFGLYLDGVGIQRIANTLNENGIKSERIPFWYPQTIRNIIRNEKYAGDLTLQKTLISDHISKRKTLNTGQLSKYVIKNDHEPIISREIFDTVQSEIVRRAAKNTRNRGVSNAFSGKIRCGICGKSYHRKTTPSNIIWCCGTFNCRGKKYCDSKAIPENTLMLATAEVLNSSTFDESLFDESIDYITAEPGNVLRFTFFDGRTAVYHWKDRSRSESWTDEMRAAAGQKKKKGAIQADGQ